MLPENATAESPVIVSPNQTMCHLNVPGEPEGLSAQSISGLKNIIWTRISKFQYSLLTTYQRVNLLSSTQNMDHVQTPPASPPASSKVLLQIPADTSVDSRIQKMFQTPIQPPVGPLKTFRQDTSDILSRIQTLLPALAKANQDLQGKDLAELDLEKVDDNQESVIEMSLGLGVFDMKPQVTEKDISLSIGAPLKPEIRFLNGSSESEDNSEICDNDLQSINGELSSDQGMMASSEDQDEGEQEVGATAI